MSKQLGGGKINKAACTPDDDRKNLQIIAEILNPIVDAGGTLPDGGTGWPNFRFKLTSVFTSRLADAVLQDADGMDTATAITVFDVQGRYTGAVIDDVGYGVLYEDTPIYEVVIIGDSAGASFDPDDLFDVINLVDGEGPAHDYSYYDPATNNFYIVGIGGGGTDELVGASGTDDTPGYLFDKIKDNNEVRDVNADPRIYADVIDTGGGTSDENVRLFLNSSVIMDYDSIPDGETWQLSLARSGTTYTVKWKKVGASGTNRWARVYGGAITAATGNETADWGDGDVKFMDDDTGVLDGSPTEVDNLWDNAWLEDGMVLIDMSFDPPRVLNGTCAAFVAWTEPE